MVTIQIMVLIKKEFSGHSEQNRLFIWRERGGRGDPTLIGDMSLKKSTFLTLSLKSLVDCWNFQSACKVVFAIEMNIN